MEKDNAKAQITLPAARSEREANGRAQQHYEQPRLVAPDGAAFEWPQGRKQHAQPEMPIYLRTLNERGTAITVAKELFRADEHRREKDRQRKAEYRQENRQDYNAYMKGVMRERAAKAKEQKSPSTPPKNPQR